MDEILEDLSLLLAHDLEKSASAIRMFFEIYKKEIPTIRDLQKWSSTTERSWIEPNKWIKWLQPPLNLVDQATTKNLFDEASLLVNDLDITWKNKNPSETPTHFLIGEAHDCFLVLKEYLRRTFISQDIHLSITSDVSKTLLVFSHISKRKDLIPGYKVALYVLNKKLLSANASMTVSAKELRLEFKKA